MAVFKDRGELEKVMSAMFDRIKQDEFMVKELVAANLKLRFRYSDPDTVMTVDLTCDPPEYGFDEQGEADVEMFQSADTGHRFWLGRLSVVRAMATGKISARGNPAKAMKLLPAIKPAFEMYPQVLKDLGMEHLIPEADSGTRKRKRGSRWRSILKRQRQADKSLLQKDTWATVSSPLEDKTFRCRDYSLPEDEDALRIELMNRMLLVREFEQMLFEKWKRGVVPTTAIHLSTGQEAVAVGICSALLADDCIATTHRGHGHMIAKGADVNRMMAEIFGKADGLCKGKGGTMHVTDREAGALGANGIVGASALLGTGAALAFKLKAEDRAAVAFFGDGAANQGMVHEAMNMAAIWDLPVLFVVENNGYGEFTPQKRHMKIEKISERARGYGITSLTIDGNDVELVHETARALMEDIRNGGGPALLECVTYRWHGHMLGDNEQYRTREEVETWMEKCPIKRQRDKLVGEGKLSPEAEESLLARAREVVLDAMSFAHESPEPDARELATDVYVFEPLPPEPQAPAEVSLLTGSAAINLALAEEMRRDPAVVLLGEDVGLGGYMAVTNGLLEEFGEKRVLDTPISEYAIVGASVGAAMSGLRPVAELLFSDFITCAMDPIVNQAAKLRYMSGGQYRVPLVVRLPGGAGLALAAQHSQSLESMLMGVPGLIIAAPSSPRDCRAMLKTAIRSDNPVLFFEHKLLYLAQGEVPHEEELLPFGKAKVVRSGRDITIVSLLYTVDLALEAAETLAKEGVDAEVIDLRCLSPLDTDTVLESVAGTGRLVTVEEGPARGGWGAEIVARTATCAHGLLKAPPVRIGGTDNPLPYNKLMEMLSVPGVKDVLERIAGIMG